MSHHKETHHKSQKDPSQKEPILKKVTKGPKAKNVKYSPLEEGELYVYFLSHQRWPAQPRLDGMPGQV
jgi:hypothetical protein